MKGLGCLAVLLFLSFGASAQTSAPAADPKPAEEAKPAEEPKPAEAQPAEAASAAGGTTTIDAKKPISMIDYAQFEDVTKIADNVATDCGSLGRQFADATEKAGRANGLTFNMSATADPRKAEQGLVLKIVSAISARNFSGGHKKTVTARAEVYLGGKMVRTTTVTRESMGGAFANLKGSCSVLERTVTTLGSDVIKWVKQGAR